MQTEVGEGWSIGLAGPSLLVLVLHAHMYCSGALLLTLSCDVKTLSHTSHEMNTIYLQNMSHTHLIYAYQQILK